jgi:hypothetical protein
MQLKMRGRYVNRTLLFPAEFLFRLRKLKWRELDEVVEVTSVVNDASSLVFGVTDCEAQSERARL